MKFSFRNIGLIESADIELKGLTVISGLNDIGKSVLSKCIFSIVKTVYRANELAIEDRNTNLQNLLQQISSVYRQSIKLASSTMAADTNQMLIGYINRINALVKDSDFNIVDAKALTQEFKELLLANLLESPLSVPHAEQGKKQLSAFFDSTLKLIKHEPINEEKYKSFFNEVVIRSIFQGQFTSKINPPLPATINVSEGEIEILKLEVDKDKTTYFNVSSDILYNEATLIESPYVVQLNDFTNVALAYLPYQIRNVRQSNLPYHVRDISLKIRNGFGVMTEDLSKVFSEISQEIGGVVHYDAQENTIVFEKENGDKIRSYNIASGIKSFGLLQMYLSSGLGNSRSLLIVDEPEVHLHLKWQLVYAEIICALVASGIPIVISTHSPFFLEALTVYAKKYNVEDSVTIYNGNKQQPGRTIFSEVPKDDLSVIFKHLSEPMAKLQMLN